MKKTLFLLLPLLMMSAWAAQSPFDGTWKVDLSSIQFSEKPEVLVLQNGVFQCMSCTPPVKIKADGTDQPTPGSPDGDTLAVKIVDDKTAAGTTKKGGRVVMSMKTTVSVDGKTSTTEFTNYPENSKQVVTGKVTYVRVAAGPSGSHAISGSWREQKLSQSENSITLKIKSTAGGISMLSPIGESNECKFDGKDCPIKGGSPGLTVAVTKLNDRTIVSTYKRDGKVVQVERSTVSADGKTTFIESENRVQGTTMKYSAIKQ